MLLNCIRQKFLSIFTTSNINMVRKRGLTIPEHATAKALQDLEFTTDQQKYVLDTLNQADTEQLVRYHVPKNRIKGFYDWRKKNGQFNSLTDVLYIEGLGVKTLTKVCRRIIELENGDDVSSKKKPVRTRGQILTPTMNFAQKQDIKTALGVHLYANGVSWARIKRDCNALVDWDSFEFQSNSKKMTPIDALQLVVKLCSKIPASDVYIFESPTAVTPAAQQSPVSVSAYAHRIQLLSMLITLLNTSAKHNPGYNLQQFDEQNKNDSEFGPDTKVFFLKHRLSARLFRTLIGSERVSAANTVAKILANGEIDKNVHSPLIVSTELHNIYNKQLPVNKEVLGQALLLIMTFMDVCVYENPNTLKIISSYCK